MELTTTVILKLSQVEAATLKSFLGSLNDKQFAEFGVDTPWKRGIMADMYDVLPDPPEKE